MHVNGTVCMRDIKLEMYDNVIRQSMMMVMMMNMMMMMMVLAMKMMMCD